MEIKQKKQTNLEKLADYINSQPNPQAFAAVLLAVAALKPRSDTFTDRDKKSKV